MPPTPLDSARNSTFRLQQKILRDASFRRREGLVWIEGPRQVLALDPGALRALFLGPGVEGHWPLPPYQLSAALAARAFATDTPQGVGALVAWRPANLETLPEGLWLILDGIRDPGNAGALVRSAAGLGVDAVVFCEAVDPGNPKTLRATAGAFFHIPIAVCRRDTLRDFFSNNPRPLLIAAARGQTHPPLPPKPVALIIGSEATGADAQWQGTRWQIPLNPHVESLNAAAAGAILLDRLRP